MRTLLAALLLLSTSIDAQTIPVSDRRTGVAGQWSFNPVAATDGSSFIVGWEERAAIAISRLEGSSLIRTAAIPTAIAALRDIVPTSEGFVVVYTNDGKAMAAFVDKKGSAVGTPLEVMSGYGAVAASNGNRVVIVNEFGDGAILSSKGSIIKTGLHVSAAERYEVRGWAAAASRDRFLFAESTTSNDIRTMIINLDGEVQSSSVLATQEMFVGSLSAASDGDQFVVAWVATDALRTASIGGAAVTLKMLNGWGAIDLTWDGAAYAGALSQDAGIERFTISRDLGSVQRSPVAGAPATTPNKASIAAIGDRSIVTWNAFSACSGGRVSDPSYGLLEISIDDAAAKAGSFGVADEIQPVVAGGTGAPLVLWTDVRDRGRLRGALIEPSSPRIAAIPEEPYMNAAAASDGSGYVIAYVTADCEAQLAIAAVDRRGDLVHREVVGNALTYLPGIFPVQEFAPAIAWNGSEYLVAWPVIGGIAGVRVSSGGVVLDRTPAMLVVTAEPGALTARIAWSGNRWLVLWWRSHLPFIPFYPGPPTVNVISIRSVDRNLQPLTGDAIVSPQGWSPAIATNGSEVLLAWRDFNFLHTALLDARGSVIGTADVRRAIPYAPLVTAAALDGRFYVLDADRVMALESGSLKLIAQLPASGVLAADNGRLVVAWAEDAGDGARRIFSMFVGVGSRRRAVR
jgi:hypothetical protein